MKELQGDANQIAARYSDQNIVYKISIEEHTANITVSVSPDCPRLSAPQAVAPPAGIQMQMIAPPTPLYQQPAPTQFVMPEIPIMSFDSKGSTDSNIDDAALQKLADEFVPPGKSEAMKPLQERLKKFEASLDDGSALAHDEKEARETFAAVRDILKEEAEKANTSPLGINAIFNKFHGGHKKAYDIAHEKGSGDDPDHEATIKKAKDMAAVVLKQFPKAQQTVSDPIVIVQQASQIRIAYNDVLKDLQLATGGELELPAGRQLKSLYRIVEKSFMRPGEMQNMCNSVLDVLRGMIIFEHDADIGKALDELNQRTEIVRVKERLAKNSRTGEGWGDILINFKLKQGLSAAIDAGSYSHICEVQFARKEMHAMRKTLGGHDEYFWFRAAMELHEVNHLPLPSMKLSNRINAKVDELMERREFGSCGSLQELEKHSQAAEAQKDAIEAQLEMHMRNKNFAACKQLQTNVTALNDQLKRIESQFNLCN